MFLFFYFFSSAKSSSGDGWKKGSSLIAAQLTTRRAPQNLTDDDSTHIKSDNLFRLIFDYRFDAFLSTFVRVEFLEEEKLFSCFFFRDTKKITFHCRGASSILIFAGGKAKQLFRNFCARWSAPNLRLPLSFRRLRIRCEKFRLYFAVR